MGALVGDDLTGHSGQRGSGQARRGWCGPSTRKGLLQPHRDEFLDQRRRERLVDAEVEGP
jgi:hypothetical protein